MDHGVRPSAFFGYTTGALEAIDLLASHGVPTFVDQIDPARTEEDLVQAEVAAWPGWARVPGRIPEVYFQRLEAEWALSTRIVVNSDWSRQGLIDQGVAGEKIVVIPLSYELEGRVLLGHRSMEGDFIVLWVGQVVLRKGIQYLVEAARMLRGQPIRFVIVGPLGITDEAIHQAPPNVTFLGPCPRGEVSEWYARADLFVFPTISDGFGITQLEAMAHGLPVIATPNCGRVVTDGVDGRIVAPRDAEALAKAIEDLASDRKLLRRMSDAAFETSRRFSIDAMAAAVAQLVDDLPA